MSEKFRERMRRNRERRLKLKLERTPHWEDQDNLIKQFKQQEDANTKKARIKDHLRQQKEEIDTWIKANEEDINVDAFIQQWQELKKTYQPLIIGSAIKYLALMDMVQSVNKNLSYKLKLENAEIDEKEVAQSLVKLSRIELFHILMKECAIEKKFKDDISKRFIAKEYPIKDGISSQPQQKPMTQQDMQKVMQESMKIELERYAKSG